MAPPPYSRPTWNTGRPAFAGHAILPPGFPPPEWPVPGSNFSQVNPMAPNRIRHAALSPFSDRQAIRPSAPSKLLPIVYLTRWGAFCTVLVADWDEVTIELLFRDGNPPAFNCRGQRIIVVEGGTCH